MKYWVRWMLKEMFLSWAAESQHATDEKKTEGDRITPTATNLMINALSASKTASALKLLSQDRENENETRRF